MARGPVLASSSSTRLCVGSLPGRAGTWLYEKDGDVYRILAQVKDTGCASRLLDLRFHALSELDLEEGVDADWGGTHHEPPRQHSTLLNGRV